MPFGTMRQAGTSRVISVSGYPIERMDAADNAEDGQETLTENEHAEAIFLTGDCGWIGITGLLCRHGPERK